MVQRLSDEYSDSVTAASKSAMLELFTALKTYSNALVLVGGWVPYFLLERDQGPQWEFTHVGSIDIDLAVDPEFIGAREYASIVEIIGRRGHAPRKDRMGNLIPFSFEKSVPSPLDGKEHTISVDFLTSEPEKLVGRKHRHRKVQPDLPARTMRGCPLAFRYNIEHKLSGVLPNDGETTVRFRMASLPAILGMKGLSIGGGYREKDAYDIMALVGFYKNGPKDVAEEVSKYLGDPLLAEGIEGIRTRFKDIKAEGPAWAGLFRAPYDEKQRKKFIAEAYVLVKEFLEAFEGATP